MLINSLNVHKNKCIYIPTHLCIHRCLSNSWQVLDVTGKMTIWRKPCSIKHRHGQSKLCFPLPPGSLYPQSESLESSFHGSSENFLLKKLLFKFGFVFHRKECSTWGLDSLWILQVLAKPWLLDWIYRSAKTKYIQIRYNLVLVHPKPLWLLAAGDRYENGLYHCFYG